MSDNITKMSGQWTQFRGNSPAWRDRNKNIPVFLWLYLWSGLRTPREVSDSQASSERWLMAQDIGFDDQSALIPVYIILGFILIIGDAAINCIHDALGCIPGSQPYSWSPRGVSHGEPYITGPAIIYHFTTFYTNRSSKSPPPRCLSFSALLDCGGEKLA